MFMVPKGILSLLTLYKVLFRPICSHAVCTINGGLLGSVSSETSVIFIVSSMIMSCINLGYSAKFDEHIRTKLFIVRSASDTPHSCVDRMLLYPSD